MLLSDVCVKYVCETLCVYVRARVCAEVSSSSGERPAVMYANHLYDADAVDEVVNRALKYASFQLPFEALGAEDASKMALYARPSVPHAGKQAVQAHVRSRSVGARA